MEGLNPTLVAVLRDMARQGSSVPDMLREIIRQLAPQPAQTLTCAKYLRDAFGSSLHEVKPIGGWSADGNGELSDANLDQLIRPAIIRNRSRWDEAA